MNKSFAPIFPANRKRLGAWMSCDYGGVLGLFLALASPAVAEELRTVAAATQVTCEQLASGTEDTQFVEISGIVRAARKMEGLPYHQIEISTGGGRLLVFAKELPVASSAELLDSTVCVRGVCSTQSNHQR